MNKNKKQRTALILLLLPLLLVLSSCSLLSSDSDSDELLESLDSLEGSLWISEYQYVGDYEKDTPIDFSSVVWSEVEKSNSLAFVDPSKVFVGAYENGALVYGRYFTVDDTNKPSFLFSHESYVSAEDYLNTKISESERQSFTQVDFPASLGGSSHKRFFLSNEYGNDLASWDSSFYSPDDNTLIRRVIYDSDSKIALMKYAKQ